MLTIFVTLKLIPRIYTAAFQKCVWNTTHNLQLLNLALKVEPIALTSIWKMDYETINILEILIIEGSDSRFPASIWICAVIYSTLKDNRSIMMQPKQAGIWEESSLHVWSAPSICIENYQPSIQRDSAYNEGFNKLTSNQQHIMRVGVCRSYPYLYGVVRLFQINTWLKKSVFSKQVREAQEWKSYDENIEERKSIDNKNNQDSQSKRNNNNIKTEE